MRSLYITIGIFCQLLLASFLVYSNLISGANGSPVVSPKQAASSEPKVVPDVADPQSKQISAIAIPLEPRTGSAISKSAKQVAPIAEISKPEVVLAPKKAIEQQQQQTKLEAKKVASIMSEVPVAPKVSAVVVSGSSIEQKPKSDQASPLEAKSIPKVAQAEPKKEPTKSIEKVSIEPKLSSKTIIQSQPEIVVKPIERSEAPKVPVAEPQVMGGLGPLHLLASTLCSPQPDRLVADETLNHLYSRRAAVRKSLYDFMSLKFTHLEKLSSRLNAGLEVTPPLKAASAQPSQPASSNSPVVPSHGWPKVDKCTAHDLRLMAEAAWCEATTGLSEQQVRSAAPSAIAVAAAAAASSSSAPLPVGAQGTPSVMSAPIGAVDSSASGQATTTSRQQMSRSLVSDDELPASAVVAKLLHVADSEDLLVGGLMSAIEPSISAAAATSSSSVVPVAKIDDLHQLNFTQQQLATLAAQAGSTRESRRNALKMTKTLFQHLSEDQEKPSQSWSQLYNMMLEDELGRKRMVDIVAALSSFRGESVSTVRRDNLEFAFAMDDLRPKVLESELNIPLTFDRQFIEVEQFLQQSVKLMLANIDPERAKLTTIRYRSLMYGNPPQMDSADDQCIDLHQRLMAQNYPTDCNPTQFGQLPDVLRMAASSLELWSIETELSRYSRQQLSGQPTRSGREDVGACIANLVTA